MRYFLLGLALFISGCQRVEVARQCQSEIDSTMPGRGLSPYSILGAINGVTIEQGRARDEAVNECIARGGQAGG